MTPTATFAVYYLWPWSLKLDAALFQVWPPVPFVPGDIWWHPPCAHSAFHFRAHACLQQAPPTHCGQWILQRIPAPPQCIRKGPMQCWSPRVEDDYSPRRELYEHLWIKQAGPTGWDLLCPGGNLNGNAPATCCRGSTQCPADLPCMRTCGELRTDCDEVFRRKTYRSERFKARSDRLTNTPRDARHEYFLYVTLAAERSKCGCHHPSRIAVADGPRLPAPNGSPQKPYYASSAGWGRRA